MIEYNRTHEKPIDVPRDNRQPRIAQVGDVVRERMRPIHEYVVTSASSQHVELRHRATGYVDEFERDEFGNLFEGEQ